MSFTHSTQRVPLIEEDVAAERTLLDAFVRFWAERAGDDLRVTYDSFVAATPSATGVTAVAVDEADARGWWLFPAGMEDRTTDSALLYLHGGGYVLGSATAYRHFASQIVKRVNRPMFLLDYPLAPERALPVAHDIALAAVKWLGRQGVRRLAIVGDSAGGGLSLSVMASLVQHAQSGASGDGHGNLPALRAGAAFSPWTDLSLSGETMTDPRVRDVLLTRDYLADCARKYLAGADPRHALASPLFGIPPGMPPLYIQAGSEELLRDDSLRYAERARELGNPVTLEIWEGLHHVFHFNVAELASARAALNRVAGFLASYL
ncbi:alpha/beta hydrolase [Cupriavidus plantarum]|nr:Monoterpene epsilon-lactone hydrolase [Cupriavidus plantarum]SMR85960.1 Acetyl esterase/lipase [Cupriavidus plantarum]